MNESPIRSTFVTSWACQIISYYAYLLVIIDVVGDDDLRIAEIGVPHGGEVALPVDPRTLFVQNERAEVVRRLLKEGVQQLQVEWQTAAGYGIELELKSGRAAMN